MQGNAWVFEYMEHVSRVLDQHFDSVRAIFVVTCYMLQSSVMDEFSCATHDINLYIHT